MLKETRKTTIALKAFMMSKSNRKSVGYDHISCMWL